MSSGPLVTCFMPTRNRRAWLPSAIRSWELQTYANRELVIIADGEDVRDLVPRDERITLVTRLDSLPMPDKFNFCCSLGKGQILCKWDDDDWSAPERISHQVQLLQQTGKNVTGYHNILFTDGQKWLRYLNPTWTSGTSLTFTRAWFERHPFRAMAPGTQVGSDGVFCGAAQVAGQLVSVPGEERMVASIHDGNTSPRRISQGSCWRLLSDFRGVAGYEWPLGVGVAA